MFGMAMESFLSSLKTEYTASKTYRTCDDARADIFDHAERFYNPWRRHSKLSGAAKASPALQVECCGGCLGPMEFEAKAVVA